MAPTTAAISLIDFSHLLETLYQAPLAEQPWHAFLNAMREHAPSISASLTFTPPGQVLPIYSVATGNTTAHHRAREYVPANPFSHLPLDRILSLTEMIPESDYTNSEFYKLFVAPFNIHYIIGADTLMKSGMAVQFRIMRSKAMGEYSRKERELCQLILPHLKQALELFLALDGINSAPELYTTNFNLLTVGSVVLNSAGKILETNAVAKSILQESEGLSMRHGGLVATPASTQTQLQALIASAASGSGDAALPAALSVRRAQKSDLKLIIRPLARGDVIGELAPAVLVLINDTARLPPLSATMIADLFGFTAAEAELAVLLADGASVDEAAERLGVSRNTVRTHLYAAFQKTGVNRQTQLVSLIVRSVAGISDIEIPR